MNFANESDEFFAGLCVLFIYPGLGRINEQFQY